MTTTTTARGPITLDDVIYEMIYRPLRTDRPHEPEYAKEPVFCANPASWHPTLWVVQQHHHPALSWRRALLKADPSTDTSWWTLSGLCGLCHDGYHTLLNMYVRAAASADPKVRAYGVPWSVHRTFGVYVRTHVSEAWRLRPAVTPYT